MVSRYTSNTMLKNLFVTGIQVSVKCKDRWTQTDSLIEEQPTTCRCNDPPTLETSLDTNANEPDDSDDSDFDPNNTAEVDESEEEFENKDETSLPTGPVHEERKFIICESALRELLGSMHCPICGTSDIVSTIANPYGTLVIVHIFCNECRCVTCTWKGQSFIGRFTVCDLLLSASILFSGASQTKVLRVLTHMGIAVPTVNTFYRHQRELLWPAVQRRWTLHQTALIAALGCSENKLVLGGDGRANSPGHSAKYGSYTVIELNENKVLHIELVQVQPILPTSARAKLS